MACTGLQRIGRRTAWLAGRYAAAGLMALAAALAAPGARGATCDTLSTPQITLIPVFAEPVVDISLDLAGLQASSRQSDSRHGELNQLLGLTTTQPIHGFEEVIEFAAMPRTNPKSDASFCGVAKTVSLRVGFETVVVHIAREVTGDRCLYDQVLQHEGQHVQVDRDGLAQFGPRIETGMREMLAALGIVHGRTSTAVGLAIRQRVQAAFDAAFNDFAQEMRRRQRIVDRPEEIRRLGQACGGAAARLAAAGRRPSKPPAD